MQHAGKIYIVFNKMITDKMIELNSEGREYWAVKGEGRWFYILGINHDNTLRICSKYHNIYDGVDLDHVK